MNIKRTSLAIAGMSLVVCVVALYALHRPARPVATPAAPLAVIAPHAATNQTSAPLQIQKRAAELTVEEKAKFLDNYERRYRPAIRKWLKAYGDHVPFNADDITPDKFVARVGVNDSFGEYVFKIDGITFSVRDRQGIAEVDYLNDPTQTKMLEAVPQRAAAPMATLPVQRPEVIAMVAADSGTEFPPDQVHMTPSGFSGSLDGGALVHVGGDPHNGGSWMFDMVFGPDGKLAYYLRGMR